MTSGIVEVDAPAKVNLRLRVLARESTGYHSLESLFCAIDLADSLRIERGGEGVRIEVTGDVDTGPEEENLAVRAAGSFLREVGAEGDGVRITLRKRIPAAAGLGGGSSDAAATLRAMNRLYGDPLRDETLLKLGIELGSDVPFFLGGSTLALGWSRGERLLALPPLPSAVVVVAHPGEAMPTRGAFQRLGKLRGGDYRPQPFRLRRDEIATWQGVAALAENDFELVAAEVMPRVTAAIAAVRKAGATMALLAGSGASLFGVFSDPSDGDVAARELVAAGFTTWQCRTIETLPEVRMLHPGTA